MSAVTTTAKAFHCYEIVEIHETCRKAHELVALKAQAAVALLNLPPSIIAAVKESTTSPQKTDNPRHVSLSRGTKLYVSSHFDDVHTAWVLLHPGLDLVNAFYAALVNHCDSCLSTETIYTVSAQHFTQDLARKSAAKWIDAYNGVVSGKL